MAALPLTALGQDWAALAVFLPGRALAFLGGRNRSLDLIALAGLPFAFALADPGRGAAASFLSFGFVAVAASRRFGRIEEAVATAALALALAVPAWFGPIAYGLGIACFVAAGAAIAREA